MANLASVCGTPSLGAEQLFFAFVSITTKSLRSALVNKHFGKCLQDLTSFGNYPPRTSVHCSTQKHLPCSSTDSTTLTVYWREKSFLQGVVGLESPT